MRTPWWISNFSLRPRRMAMVSSTVGSPTSTVWKRRARAASFSTCFLYSLRVVAPMQRSSPRASAGFSRLAASMAPSRRAGAHQRVQLVDEADDFAVGIDDLLHHGLEAVFELAAELGAGDHRAEVDGHQFLVLELVGHVAAHDALGQAFHDGGLAHAGLADQHRVVLGAAAEHLHDAADLVVAADHRVELALAGGFGEVVRVALQRLVFGFGILVGDALACRAPRPGP